MNNHRLIHTLHALYAIATALNDGTSEQALLDAFVQHTVTEFGYTGATLRLLDEEQQTLELRAAYGLRQNYLRNGPVAIGYSKIDQSVLAGHVVVVEDVPHDPSSPDAHAALDDEQASTLFVPLLVHERTIGILRVYAKAPHRFTDEEHTLLTAVANLGAQAIRRTQRACASQSIARAVMASLDLNAVLTALVGSMVREVHVKAGSIHLLGPRKLTLYLAAATGLSAAYLAQGTVAVAQSPIDQHVIHGGQPLAITEISHTTGLEYPEAAQREGIRAILVVPLQVHDRVIGVLRLYSGQTRRFDADDIAFATTLADLGALALENARLHATLTARLDAAKADSNAWYRYLTMS